MVMRMCNVTRLLTRITLVSLLMTGFAWGQGGKIAFVNSQVVLNGTNEGRNGMAELDRYWSGVQQQYDAKNQDLNQLQQDYRAKQRSANATVLAALQRDIDQKQLGLKRFQEDSQAELTRRQNEMLQQISDKVQQIVQDFAQQNGYLVIFMRDQTQAYVSPDLDVSQEIIRLYNERHPAPSESGTAAPSPATQP